MKKIAIIGAGLSGLTLARQLADIAQVTVFEKHHRVSGRMATREHEAFAFDHGAQFFTVKHPAFATLIEEMQADGVVARWEARFAEIDGINMKAARRWDAAFPHYVGVPNMSSVGEWMHAHLHQRGVQIQLNTKVAAIEKRADVSLLLDDNSNLLGNFDWVMTAIPAAQAANLMPSHVAFISTLREVKMLPCYALMLGFEQPLKREWDVAHVANSVLSWISVNSTKPERNAATTLVTMSRNQWAADHFDASEPWVMDTMMHALSAILGDQVYLARLRLLKKWHYANAQKYCLNDVLVDTQARLASCGDWCISGRVESAFVSAWQLADAMRRHFDSA